MYQRFAGAHNLKSLIVPAAPQQVAQQGGVAGPAFDSPAFPLAPHRSPELMGFCMSEVSMHNLRAALTATIDTIRMGIKLWRTAKRREREAGRQ